MLVPENIVRQWYHKNSWVYRNFEYLFKNALWSKQVPEGFSVCPYFWLSLFSFFVFRPIVTAWSRALSPLFYNTIGRPFASLDLFALRLLHRVVFSDRSELDDDSIKKGMRGMGVAFFAAVLGVAILIVYGLSKLYLWYTYDVVESTLYIVEFWSVAGGIILAIGAGMHALNRRRKGLTRCRTEAYLYVWAVLVLVALCIFAPTEMKGLVLNLAAGFVFVLKAIGGWLVTVFRGSVWGLWIVLVFVGHYLYIGFSYAPLGLPIPWWLYAVAAVLLLSSYGWIVERWIQKYEQHMDTQELRAYNRQRWVDFMSNLIWKDHWVDLASSDNNEDRRKAFRMMAPQIIRRATETYWKDQLDVLQECSPFYTKLQLKALKESKSVQLRVDMAWQDIPVDSVRVRLTSWVFHEDQLVNAIAQAKRDAALQRQFEEATTRFAAMRRRAEERLKRAADSPWHKACMATTTAILSVVKWFGRQIAQGAGAVAYGAVWAVKQFGIFVVYMWMLIKAKKQKACPYFRFED